MLLHDNMPDMRMRFRYGNRHRIQPLDGAVRKQCTAAMKQEGCNIQIVQRVQSPAETPGVQIHEKDLHR